MNNAELLLTLTIVEEDHQLVLNKMQALKEAVSLLLELGDDALLQALRRLREMHRYFTTEFASHMEEEETALFPLLERAAPEGPALVRRLREEHDEIRRRCDEFGNHLAYAAQLDDNLPRAVVRDLLHFGWQLWEYLDQHAYAETRGVHQCVATALEGDGPKGGEPGA